MSGWQRPARRASRRRRTPSPQAQFLHDDGRAGDRHAQSFGSVEGTAEFSAHLTSDDPAVRSAGVPPCAPCHRNQTGEPQAPCTGSGPTLSVVPQAAVTHGVGGYSFAVAVSFARRDRRQLCVWLSYVVAARLVLQSESAPQLLAGSGAGGRWCSLLGWAGGIRANCLLSTFARVLPSVPDAGLPPRAWRRRQLGPRRTRRGRSAGSSPDSRRPSGGTTSSAIPLSMACWSQQVPA